MLLEALQGYSDFIENLDEVEAGLRVAANRDDGNIDGAHYLCNTKTEEVFYLEDVHDYGFYNAEDTPIVSRNHLSEFHRGLSKIKPS